MPSLKPCTEVREDGVYTGKEWSPHCVQPADCEAAARCFWRKFHQLPGHKYRQKQEQPQQDLFA
jgi:hypothetical protein